MVCQVSGLNYHRHFTLDTLTYMRNRRDSCRFSQHEVPMSHQGMIGEGDKARQAFIA